MRNCFVPGCDAYCKRNNTVQRKMFLAPTKLFNEWANVLVNKRNFKQHDRVCERHFEEADIIQFWEANINGKVHLTPRDKPKLREDAIPSKNLPKREDFVPISDSPKNVPKNDLLKKRSEKIEILSNKIIASNKRAARKKIAEPVKTKRTKLTEKEETLETCLENVPEAETKLDNDKTSTAEVAGREEVVDREMKTETSEEKLAMFESLYEEAFDVTLPNLLWGIHRDPDRKFIAFSEFNQSTMSMSKLFHITDTCQYKILINNQLKSSKTLPHELLTADHLSSLLDELEKDPLPP